MELLFIDWGTIVQTTIITLVSGGLGSLATFFLFLRQRTKKENSDVVDKDASAATNMLDFTDKYQDFTVKMIDNYQKAISDKDEALNRCNETILQNQKKLMELEQIIQNHGTKIRNISLSLIGEQRKKQYAEQNICLVKDCNLRQPSMGTFKTEDVIDEKNINI